jgi:hypothetical protein
MKIKKYINFLKESEDNSFGEWVESLIDHEYVKNIVNRFIGNLDPSIRVANAVNILNDWEKSEIKNQINKYLDVGIEEKEPSVRTSVNKNALLKESNSVIKNRGIFNSFLKSLTALGRKETKSNPDKCPNNFLFFYYYDNINVDDVKSIFNRFKSLSVYNEYIQYDINRVNLYFGIRCDSNLEYGISGENLTKFGEFKLTKSNINWILSLESKSANSLKYDLVNLTLNNIETLSKIKIDMEGFNPGYYEKKSQPVIKDRIITFGWYGVGKWDNGKLDTGELWNIKNNFNMWVISKKWAGKVLISINPKSFWLWIHLKIK